MYVDVIAVIDISSHVKIKIGNYINTVASAVFRVSVTAT